MNVKFFILLFVLILNGSNIKAGQIKIKVTNIEEKVGQIHFALYDKPEYFPEEKGKILGLVEDAAKVFKDGFVINDLQESFYAVAIYHDENSNNEFDTFLSIPQEKYGFSNDAPVLFGPPKFKQAEFYVGQSDMIEIEIRLR